MPDLSKPALLLIGHGSRHAQGLSEFHRLASKLWAALPERLVVSAFLELAEPSIAQGVQQLVEQGARAITALPGMLLAAGHLKNDIPLALRAVQAIHPQVPITLGVELGLHPAMLQAAAERLVAGEAAFGPGYDRRETLLLVVGRGTSDPDANGNMAFITRWLWQTLGFGWAETAYCAVTPPAIQTVLEPLHGLGYRQLIVLPYVLFAGHLIHQIEAAVAAYRVRHGDVYLVQAPYLGDHPQVLTALLDRWRQTEAGQGVMNCALCQYHVAIPGYEHQQGRPQTTHTDAPP